MHIKGFTKFNIGDLVCLSAYGEARDYNCSYHGHWGIIVETGCRVGYPYRVEFLSTGRRNRFEVFHPRELKHMKPKKSNS